MNKLKTIIVAGFALAASTTAASAEGLYVGGQLGFSGGGGEFNNTGTDLVLGMGRIGSLAIGKEFGNARVEGEIALRHNNMDNYNGSPISGKMSSTANVTIVSPAYPVDDNETTFALQLMLGGVIPLTDSFAMTVDWRVLGAVPSFQSTSGIPFEQDYGTSSLMLGARYSF
jgi:opacity protein-like surface antigen